MQADHALSLMEFAIKREAAENLLRLNMMDYPNMKKESRSKLYKQIKNTAFPISEQKLLTTEDLAEFLNG